MIKNPVLYLPKLERNDIGAVIRQAIEGLRKTYRSYTLPDEIVPLIFEKYPKVKERIEPICSLILEGYNISNQIIESASDDRWDRSLIDWMPICDTAKVSLNNAKKNFFAITSEGKKKYLSTKYIKQKKQQIQKFIPGYEKFVPIYNVFVHFISIIVEYDHDRRKEAQKLELDYMREKVPELLQLFKNKLLEVQGDTKGTFSNQNKFSSEDILKEYHEYVEFRYHDKKVYAKQKLKIKQGKRKSNPDGWKTCHILRVDELPKETVEYLRRKQGRHYNSHK